jgi:hypothetical protein
MFSLLWVVPALARSLDALSMPDVTLVGTDGQSRPMRAVLKQAKTTVLVFFSTHCDCQKAHDATLAQLSKEFSGQGVQFFMVDSEAGSSLEIDKSESQARHYPFPVLRDEKGVLSQAFEAQFATTTVVLDANGRVHYRGGIDSSRKEANASTRPFLQQALQSISQGQEPVVAEPKALGCYLRRA